MVLPYQRGLRSYSLYLTKSQRLRRGKIQHYMRVVESVCVSERREYVTVIEGGLSEPVHVSVEREMHTCPSEVRMTCHRCPSKILPEKVLACAAASLLGLTLSACAWSDSKISKTDYERKVRNGRAKPA